MKNITPLVFVLLSLNASAQFYNTEDDTNGFNIGLHVGVVDLKAPVAQFEFGIKSDDVMVSYNLSLTPSTTTPIFHDVRIGYYIGSFIPYIGVGYQEFTNDWVEDDDKSAIPPNKFNPVYGIRYQWRKLIVGAGMNGKYSLFSVGLTGKLP